MYGLDSYDNERIAVIINDEDELRWFVAKCVEQDYRVVRPGWFPASLSGWGTWDSVGYFKKQWNIPEVTIDELREYADDHYFDLVGFREGEFLELIGG